MVKLESGHKIKTLQSDGGGEYVSGIFEEFCTKEGIHHQLVCVHASTKWGGVKAKYNTPRACKNHGDRASFSFVFFG